MKKNLFSTQLLFLIIVLFSACSFEKPVEENSIYNTFFSEKMLKHVIVVNRTLVYQPKRGSFTEIIKFGIPKYDYRFDIFIADQRDRSIKKIAEVNGHSFLASRILELQSNYVLIELVNNQGKINNAMTFKIGFDGSMRELQDKKREVSMSELNRISNSRFNRPYSDFEIDSNRKLAWKSQTKS